MAADYRSNDVSGCSPSDAYRVSAKSHLRAYTLVGAMTVGLLASACTATTSTPKSSPSNAAATAPTSSLHSGAAKLTTLRQSAHVLGKGTYSSYTVAVPSDWSNLGNFVIKGGDPSEPGPVLGLSVWNVGLVYRDPCHWKDSGFVPKPGVDNLVAALVAQKLRNATTPTDVTLAGYPGKYLELSVPADMKSSSWTDFDACDVAADGIDRDFAGWLGNGEGERYEQVPGQIDQLWILDVNGQRLLVDATYSPDTSEADREQLDQVVSSLHFVS